MKALKLFFLKIFGIQNRLYNKFNKIMMMKNQTCKNWIK